MKTHLLRLISAILSILLLLSLTACSQSPQTVTAENVRTVSITGFKDTESAQHISISSEGLEVCRIGTYSGIFVEQGTDTECDGIPAIVVRNTAAQMIEKAVLTRGTQTFVVTYLPPQGICLVQAQTGQRAAQGDAACKLVFAAAVQFAADASLHEERVRLTAAEKTVSIENISGEDIPGSVNVWYKVLRNGLYFGGVSYKAGVDDGVLCADSIASVHTAHFDPAETQILLVTFSND